MIKCSSLDDLGNSKLALEGNSKTLGSTHLYIQWIEGENMSDCFLVTGANLHRKTTSRLQNRKTIQKNKFTKLDLENRGKNEGKKMKSTVVPLTKGFKPLKKGRGEETLGAVIPQWRKIEEKRGRQNHYKTMLLFLQNHKC